MNIKKFFPLVVLAMLFAFPNMTNAGDLTAGCFPVVDCDKGADFYGGGCNPELNSIDSTTPSCVSVKDTAPDGKFWAFSCDNGCYLKNIPVAPACANPDVNTGSTLPCCADDQIVVRDSATSAGWSCQDQVVEPTVNNTTIINNENITLEGDTIVQGDTIINGDTVEGDTVIGGATTVVQTTSTTIEGDTIFIDGDHITIGDVINDDSVCLGGSCYNSWSTMVNNYSTPGLWKENADGIYYSDGNVAIGTGAKATGSAAYAIGYNAQATNNGAIAMHNTALASGAQSVAIGYNSEASAGHGMALGSYANANGQYSQAIGYNATTSGKYSAAVGHDSSATAEHSVAIGYGTQSNYTNSVAIGYQSKANNTNTFAIGDHTEAKGYYTTAMGRYTTAQAQASFVIGQYNVIGGNPSNWTVTDPLFVIGNGTSDTLRSNAVTVLKNGNVGIGTNSAIGPLHIRTDIDAGGTESEASFVIGDPDGTHTEFDNNEIMAKGSATTTGTLYLQNNGGDLRINGSTFAVDDSENSVGIGTTSPDATLDVNGNIAFGTQGHYLDADDDSWVRLKDGDDGNYTDLAVGDFYVDNYLYGSGTYLDLGSHVNVNNKNLDYVNQLHFNDNVRLYDNGDDSWLNLKRGDTAGGGMRLMDGDGVTDGYLYGSGDGQNFGLLDSDGSWAVRINKDDYVAFRVNDDEKMRVNSDGALGIGDTSPNAMLHVKAPAASPDGYAFRVQIDGDTELATWDNGGTSIGANTKPHSEGLYVKGKTQLHGTLFTDGNIVSEGTIYSNGGTDGGFVTNPDVVNDFVFRSGNDTGAFKIYEDGTYNNGVRFTIKSGGFIGIGDTSPSYKLDVNGTVRATSGFVPSSDRRLKKDITPLNVDALKLVSNLKPVTFEWKEITDPGSEGTQIGFIAQDMEEVIPELVTTADDEEQTKGVKYDGIIPVLTKAIQELKAEKDAEIQKQQDLIKNLEERITALEADK